MFDKKTLLYLLKNTFGEDMAYWPNSDLPNSSSLVGWNTFSKKLDKATIVSIIGTSSASNLWVKATLPSGEAFSKLCFFKMDRLYLSSKWNYYLCKWSRFKLNKLFNFINKVHKKTLCLY